MFSYLRSFFCCKRTKEKGVYLLKLTDNKYYVGESTDIKRRIWLHENGQGSSWTKKYEVVESMEPKGDNGNKFLELIQTLKMMREYGVDNVRGSLFTSPYPLSPYEKIMAAQLYCDLYGLCRRCGSHNHFITQCKTKTVEEWVNQFGGKLRFEDIDTKRVCLECDTDISSLPKNYRYCRKCFYDKNKY